MTVNIPTDATPYVTGSPTVQTRVIWDRWNYIDGSPITAPPRITHLGTPYRVPGGQATLFGKDSVATLTSGVGESNQGVWWAEVIVNGDPDLVGDVRVRISHDLLPGGSMIVAVPAGSGPINVGSLMTTTDPGAGVMVISGKTAYEYAVQGGYTGTEASFATALANAGNGVGGSGGTSGPVDWTAITNKPTTFAPIIGATATTAVAGNDIRLTDQRVPTDNSVTNAKVSASAAISVDKTVDGTTNKVFTAVEKTKLSLIAASATANSTDAQLRDRTTHTGVTPVAGIGTGTPGAGKYVDGGTGAWTTLPAAGASSANVMWVASTAATRPTVPAGYQLIIIGGSTAPSWMQASDLQLATE